MGLDVYLNKCADLDAASAIEKQASDEVDKIWGSHPGGYEDMTQEQRDAIHAEAKAVRERFGLDEWGSHPDKKETDVPASQVDPEHYFKLNYLRSSYNGSGFNRVMRNAELPTLNDIFGVDDDSDYHFRPDWAACLVRVNSAIEGYAAHLQKPGGNVRVMEVRHNTYIDPNKLPSSEAAALKIYQSEAANQIPTLQSYANSKGEFYHDGLTVRALIPGIGRGRWTEPVVFVVIDAPVEPGKEDWYLTALKITREMIEHVLGQPDAQDYYLTWSA